MLSLCVQFQSYRFPSSTGHAAVSPMQLMELTHEIAPGIVKAAVRVHSELMHKEGQKKDVEVRSVGVSVKVSPRPHTASI